MSEQLPEGKNVGLNDLLGATHTGMKISASGILGRISEGRYYKGLNYGCGVMLGHLQQMADRFYAGDAKAVDEFLQLYCLDDKRPEMPNAGLSGGAPKATPSRLNP